MVGNFYNVRSNRIVREGFIVLYYKIDSDFKSICQQIIDENKAEEEWALVESDDMFQTKKYIGGFDATENEFCFSVYIGSEEYWFQVSIEQVKQISSDILDYIIIYPVI